MRSLVRGLLLGLLLLRLLLLLRGLNLRHAAEGAITLGQNSSYIDCCGAAPVQHQIDGCHESNWGAFMPIHGGMIMPLPNAKDLDNLAATAHLFLQRMLLGLCYKRGVHGGGHCRVRVLLRLLLLLLLLLLGRRSCSSLLLLRGHGVRSAFRVKLLRLLRLGTKTTAGCSSLAE